MGFFDLLLGNKNQIPTVTSILPDAAKQEILAGRLPVLRTNQRVVFQAKEWGFDKTYRYLSAITPYSDACEMQFGNKTYCLIVADGNLLNHVLKLIQKRRQIP